MRKERTLEESARLVSGVTDRETSAEGLSYVSLGRFASDPRHVTLLIAWLA
jgi:hypothetical protein